MRSLQSAKSLLIAGGCAIFAATSTLAITRTPLGSPLFFGIAALASAAYLVVLRGVWALRNAPRSWLYAALACAVLVRLPVIVVPVDSDSDMVRYLWDGRVQRLGYNPFQVVPADPAMAATHTDLTRNMPSRRARTPYPPAAQLFFRLVATLHETTRGMKVALVGCDLLTMIVLWRWLIVTGRNEWLTLAYAWNPLVILEIAHSGHIDALATLWIVASAYWLARRRTLLASIAFVLAVGTKLLPVVLAPLYWKRIRIRDALGAAVMAAALYLPFTSGSQLPLGAVPNVVAHIRFNSALFSGIEYLASPQVAAAMALLLGVGVAIWARWRLPADEPAAWAWPMAFALVCAPVIYPWYLLPLTPFLFTRKSLPLLVWILSVIPVYMVWSLSRHGGRWIAPAWLQGLELAAFATAFGLALRTRCRSEPGPTAELP